MSLVSVIIPNYNHASFLEQRIDSVLNQTFQDFELIILDDCSTDNSMEVVEKCRNCKKVSNIVYNEKNSGSTFKQWEKGIALAKGEYIWIAESDDYSETTFLETAVSILNKENSCLFFCQSYGVDNNGEIERDYLWWTENLKAINWNERFFLIGEEFIVKALQYKNVIPNASAVVFKKKGFDFTEIRRYKTSGDWLFWINLLSKSNISYSPQKLNYFRSHTDTTRNRNNRTKFLQYLMEELSIKYKVYNLNLIRPEELRSVLIHTIDQMIPNFNFFKRSCKQYNLPFIFLFEFFLRKIKLKMKRLNFNQS